MSLSDGRAFEKLQKVIDNRVKQGDNSIDLSELKHIMSHLSQDEFTKRTTGTEIAEELSDFANSNTSFTEKEFVDFVLSEHRTLQQSMFRLFYSCMLGWSDMAKTGMYDLRNEATCKMSEKAVESTIDDGIPLV